MVLVDMRIDIPDTKGRSALMRPPSSMPCTNLKGTEISSTSSGPGGELQAMRPPSSLSLRRRSGARPHPRPRDSKITRLIANQKASFSVYRPTAEQVKDHTRSGLAPVANMTVGNVNRVWMIRAITNVIDMGTCSGKFCGEVRVHCAHIIFRVKPTRYTGLVCHDKHVQSRIFECPHRTFGALNPAKSFDLADISVVMVKDSVAAETRPPAGAAAREPRGVPARGHHGRRYQRNSLRN